MCQLFLSVSFYFMTLQLYRNGVIICIHRGVRDVSISDCNVAPVCVMLQVEEVKKHNHCLAFSSAGPQSQTYYVSFDSFTEHLRWHRHAAKVLCVCMCMRVKE